MSEVEPHPFGDVTFNGTDYRDLGPTMDCPCGSSMIYLLATLDPETRDVGMYFTDALCDECGSLLKAACPADDVEPWPSEFTEVDYYEPSGQQAADAARVHEQIENIRKAQLGEEAEE